MLYEYNIYYIKDRIGNRDAKKIPSELILIRFIGAKSVKSSTDEEWCEPSRFSVLCYDAGRSYQVLLLKIFEIRCRSVVIRIEKIFEILS